MEKMKVEELQGFANEYEMVCAAQAGNQKAWMGLFEHYKRMMMSRLVATKGMTTDELQSEAAETFANEIVRFDRDKVKSKDGFSFFIRMFQRAQNKTDLLIRRRKREVHLYFEKVNAATVCTGESKYCSPQDDDNGSLQNQMLGVNDGIYYTYAPEKMVFESLKESDTDRVKAFYAKLTTFEKDILEARREGLTIINTAKRLHCSATTVKMHLRSMKAIASEIFDVAYA